MKKLIAAVLAMALCLSLFAACSGDTGGETGEVKVGFIFLHDEYVSSNNWQESFSRNQVKNLTASGSTGAGHCQG